MGTINVDFILKFYQDLPDDTILHNAGIHIFTCYMEHFRAKDERVLINNRGKIKLCMMPGTRSTLGDFRYMAARFKENQELIYWYKHELDMIHYQKREDGKYILINEPLTVKHLESWLIEPKQTEYGILSLIPGNPNYMLGMGDDPKSYYLVDKKLMEALSNMVMPNTHDYIKILTTPYYKYEYVDTRSEKLTFVNPQGAFEYVQRSKK